MSAVDPAQVPARLDRFVYIARAVDNRPEPDFRRDGERLAAKIAMAGFTPIDPVLTPFPGFEERNLLQKYDRVLSDLEWIRRSDALVADMAIPDWPYVGCICELVYARWYGVPTIVITGDNQMLGERVWLRYHADFVDTDEDNAIEFLRKLPPGARAESPRG